MTGNSIAGPPFAAQLYAEAHLRIARLDLDGADLRFLGESVGHECLGYLRRDLPHTGIVDAQHRHAVERQMLKEIDEGLPQLLEAWSYVCM